MSKELYAKKVEEILNSVGEYCALQLTHMSADDVPPHDIPPVLLTNAATLAVDIARFTFIFIGGKGDQSPEDIQLFFDLGIQKYRESLEKQKRTEH